MQLILNGIVLDFEGEIEMKMCSPLFNEERTFSYEFAIKSTPTNDRAFGFARCPDSIVDKVKYNDFIIDCNWFQYFGNLTLRGVEKMFYKLSFCAEPLQEKLKSFRLKSLNKVYPAGYANTFIDRANEYDCVLPTIHYPSANTDTSEIGGYNRYSVYKKEQPFIPHFYLKKILQMIFDKYGVKPVYEIAAIEKDFEDLLLANNYACDLFRYDTYGLFIFNIKGYGYDYEDEDGAKYSELVFECLSPDLKYNQEELVVFKSSGYTSFPLANKFYTLELLREYQPADPEESKRGLYKLKSAKVDNLPPYSNYANDGLKISRTGVKKTIAENFNIKNHVPDITFGQLVKAIEELLFLKFIPDDKLTSCRIVMLDNIISDNECTPITQYRTADGDQTITENKGFYISFASPSDDRFSKSVRQPEKRHTIKDSVNKKEDLPTVAESNDLRLVTSENAYYEYSASSWAVLQESGTEGTWQFYSYNVLQTENADASYKHICGAVPLAPDLQNFAAALGKSNRRYAYYNCAFGNRIHFADMKYDNDFKDVRLLFYRGFYTYSTKIGALNYTEKVPFCTTTDKDVFGDKLPYANLSLDLNSENSIINKLGKKWCEFRASMRNVSAMINWPAPMLQNFDWLMKYELDGNLYFIKAIPFSLKSNDDIKFKETEMAKC